MKSLKEERIGQFKKMNCGKCCTIVDYIGANNITVEFESGKIVKNKSYQNFIKGKLREFSDEDYKELRIGEEKIMNCGMKATIINYIDCKNIDVMFEDGYISKNKNYSRFLEGSIHNKNLEYNNFIDLTNKVFGRWTVLYKDKERIIEKHNKNKENGNSASVIYWICRCECGNIGSIVSSNLKLGFSRSCGCLESELTIKRNIETKSIHKSIKEENPKMSDLIVNEEDKDITIGSKRKILIECPKCKETKLYPIYRLNEFGFSCPNCSKKTSYPNRFIYKLLRELNLEFKTEKTFKEIPKKRYDFYIPNLDMIIEAHGMQHYKDCTWSLEEKQRLNDIYKEEKSKELGIKIYIQLDCRYSDFEYIKQSILNSELRKIFNIENIDWLKIKEELKLNVEKEG